MTAPVSNLGRWPSRSEYGIALPLALVFLLLLSLLGVTAMQTSTLQERMAGNERDRGVAFEAAEAGLRMGEAELRPVPPSGFTGNTDGLYTEGGLDESPIYEQIDWSSDGAVHIESIDGADGEDAEVGGLQEVRYIIVRLDPAGPPGIDTQAAIGERQFYRITARGVGTSGKSVVFLQSTVRTK